MEITGSRQSNFRYAAYAIIALAYVALSVSLFESTPIKRFPDTGSYLRTAELSVFDAAFWTAERPASVPLFFKLAGRDFDRITLMQQALSVACWLALAASAATTMKASAVKITAFTVTLAFSLAADIHFWNRMILSESLAMSLLALSASLWLQVFLRLPQIERLPAHTAAAVGLCLVAVTAFWSMTRDSHMYPTLAIAGFSLVSLLWRKQGARFLFATTLIGCTSIFVLQNASADGGNRWLTPFLNVLGERVLPSDDATSFFLDNGLPDHPLVHEGIGRRADYFRRMRRELPTFRGWVQDDGRSTYIRYLLGTPVESIAAPLRQLDRLLLIDRNLLHYSSNPAIPAWQSALSDVVFPKNGWFHVWSLGGMLLLAYSLVARRIDRRWAVPIALAALVYPTIFLAWHGDTIEAERHAFLGALQWRLALWLIVLLTLDRVAARPANAAQVPE